MKCLFREDLVTQGFALPDRTPIELNDSAIVSNNNNWSNSQTITKYENDRPNEQFLTVLQANCQCIRNKLLDIEHVCQLQNVDVICASEHWLTPEQADMFIPQNFDLANIVCRTNFKNGGSAIYVKKRLSLPKN